MGGLRLLPLCLVLGFAVSMGTAVGVVLVAEPARTAPSAPTVVGTEPDTSPEVRAVTCEGAPLQERAAQVLVVGVPGVTAPTDPLVEEVLDVGVGGVLLTDANVESAEQVRGLVSALRRGAAHGLLVTTDEEPGRVSSFRTLLGATSSARTLAARGDPADVHAFARDLGGELAALGVDVTFAPVVDVDDGPARGIIGDRAFSGDPETAATYGLAFSEGLTEAGVHPAAKHFPGHGRSDTDSHRTSGLVEASLRELRTTDLVPFAAQIDAGVPLVMVNHVAYRALDPELPASLAAPTYALLRDMGFTGVAITDSTGMGAVHGTWDFPTSAVMAVRAGADAVLTTDGNQARAMRDALVEAVRDGDLDADRLDEAAGRVLALKGEDTEAVVCHEVAPAPTMRPVPGRAGD
ncbi:MAG: glycoside hydrolase family 3 N-terminal domain-containing protein [Egibacteraceae bacterium]